MYSFKNHQTSDKINSVLEYIIEKEEFIEFVQDGGYYLIIKLCGYEIKMWNANKYHEWLISGIIYQGNQLLMLWDDEIPNRSTMWKFRNLLNRCREKLNIKGV